jgi:hypothetical protein
MTSRKEVFHNRRALLFPDLLSIGPLAVGIHTPLVFFIPVSLVFQISDDPTRDHLLTYSSSSPEGNDFTFAVPQGIQRL